MAAREVRRNLGRCFLAAVSFSVLILVRPAGADLGNVTSRPSTARFMPATGTTPAKLAVWFNYTVSTQKNQSFSYTGGTISVTSGDPAFSGTSEAEEVRAQDKGEGGDKSADVMLCDTFDLPPGVGEALVGHLVAAQIYAVHPQANTFTTGRGYKKAGRKDTPTVRR